LGNNRQWTEYQLFIHFFTPPRDENYFNASALMQKEIGKCKLFSKTTFEKNIKGEILIKMIV
jgi:hypothetical protein